MERIRHQRHAEAIREALSLVPDAVRDRVRPHWLTGTDPVFAGLHRYEEASHERSYRTTAHCTYPYHQTPLLRADRHTTIVLPTEDDFDPTIILHEYGHAVDEHLGFHRRVTPLGWYARTRRSEAFAEAFTAWVLPERFVAAYYRFETLIDPDDRAYFEAVLLA